jgi:hypothetical protein
MKYTIARTGLAVLFAAALIAGMAAPAHAWDRPCSMGGAAGKYAFTDGGTVIGIGPRAAVGTLTLDASGNVLNGLATSSLNGSVAVETFSGTYTLNPDCTGTISVKIYAGSSELFAVTLNYAFDSDMRQLRGIFTSIVTPGGVSLPSVISLEARKQ